MVQLIVQIALIIVVIRNGYLAITYLQSGRKPWLDLSYRIALVVLALSFLF